MRPTTHTPNHCAACWQADAYGMPAGAAHPRRRAVTVRLEADARRMATAGAILAACVAVLMFTIGAAYPAHGATAPALASSTTVVPPASLVAMLTPCPSEDSSGCYWDAGTMGNGRGVGFYAVAVTPGAVCVRFWSDAADDYCADDGYAATDAPRWEQIDGATARYLTRHAYPIARPVDYWARCAWRDGVPAIVCPDGYRFTTAR